MISRRKFPSFSQKTLISAGGVLTGVLLSFVILAPFLLLVLWSFAGRWPWPLMLPENFTLRTYRELLTGSSPLLGLLASSLLLSCAVGLITTFSALLTARSTLFLSPRGRTLVDSLAFLPFVVPGTVFAMGFQLILLRIRWADTLGGVLLSHTIVAFPYALGVLSDLVHAIGSTLEEQAITLGARPLYAFCSTSLPLLLPGLLSAFSLSFTISWSQYFTTLIVGGGRVKTLSLVLVPYIQSGDRALAAVYSVAFVGFALALFFCVELLLRKGKKGEKKWN